jgi:hypothetical protein
MDAVKQLVRVTYKLRLSYWCPRFLDVIARWLYAVAPSPGPDSGPRYVMRW